jgi:hypothetical protein
MSADNQDDDQDDRADADLDELEDVEDRDELRQRYYGLLQELRVMLPGVQVLLAFLLTVPFSQRFEDLNDPERATFSVAMLAATISVVCLLTPTVYHRIAVRTERVARLRWGIRMTVAGLFFLAVALVSALWCIAHFVFGSAEAWTVTAVLTAAIIVLWFALPSLTGRGPDPPTR